jgi:phosphate-selective porin OprO/OprP
MRSARGCIPTAALSVIALLATVKTAETQAARAAMFPASLAMTSSLMRRHSQSQGQPGETKVDASRGGITISSGVNSLTIGARVQVRWTLDDREQAYSDNTGEGHGENDGPLSQFDVPRLRVTLSGGVWREWLKYLFQFDFSRTSGEGDSKIKDAIVEIRPPGRPFRFQAGQFKAPFGLQQITSSGRLQFVDRAITDAKFNPGREMGAMFAGTAVTRKVGYEVGVFNGSGESVRQNNRAHLLAGRVFVNPFGPYALAEGSSDASDKPVLHVGVAARTGDQIRGRTQTGIFDDADNQTAVDIEFAYKAPRLYATAEYFWMTDAQENPTAGRDIESDGFHAQIGYMLVPRSTEVGLRYARIAGDTDTPDAEVTEWRAVGGYYWHAHNLKLQADVGQVGYGANFAVMPARARQGLPSLGTRLVTGTDLTDTQVRVQLQVAF